MASLQLRNKVWHIRYRDRRGRQRTMSTEIKTSKQGDKAALKKLENFERDRRAGIEPGSAVHIGKLLDLVVSNYADNRRKSPETLAFRIANLKPWFGGIRSDKLTKSDVVDYVTDRRKEGASNSTINRELKILGRAFKLGRETEQTDRAPYIPRLKEPPPRQGFPTRAHLDAMTPHLPERYRDLALFLFLTGWRIGEARNLEWRHVDFDAGEIYIDVGAAKNEEGRSFPMTDELRALLKRLEAAKPKGTILPQVFVYERWHARQAKRRRKDRELTYLPIGNVAKAWNAACKAAGIPAMWRHDFRRAAVRTFDRSGIPRKVAMVLSGHKTEAIYERYNIASRSDLETARERLNMWAKREQPEVKEPETVVK